MTLRLMLLIMFSAVVVLGQDQADSPARLDGIFSDGLDLVGQSQNRTCQNLCGCAALSNILVNLLPPLTAFGYGADNRDQGYP